MHIPQVRHRFADVDGVRVFYREAGPASAPVLLALHGFPSASHQFRRLMDALGDRYRVIAPDYPGFGYTEPPEGFPYSFDTLADVVEGLVRALGLTKFAMYTFDFGGPVGMRLATRHPEWVTGLVIQNANAYDEGLSDLARQMIANRPGVEGAEPNVRQIPSNFPSPAASTRAAPPTSNWSLPTAGPSTSTSSTCPADGRPRSRWHSTTTPTSPCTRPGSSGYATTGRPL